MEYLNAADVLPKKLLKELSTYVNGQLLYVPSTENKKSWGSKSGSRQYYEQRNSNIVELYQKNTSIDELCEQFNLSYDTIRKIIKVNLWGCCTRVQKISDVTAPSSKKSSFFIEIREVLPVVFLDGRTFPGPVTRQGLSLLTGLFLCAFL